ncbi:hypothetical protein GLW08_13460 [Pontibacillus yanchengensis]|uniref:Uncharacterized protein n=1 Tax=Pontibacillus yanchengensis TaxID=462910 RepID=A0ACC7VI04_9BACI|nr:TasA family protein [Pontibacillus yanchengensis]MYL54337.1 hypothetical protein [Pontibacillus yanchengensis]
MGIKSKLAMGVMTGALGLSLVGGGTWAAYNDTATINNTFASGELDLVVGKSSNKPISFDLSNLKPGDNIQRIFKLNNAGSLAIKEVLLDVTADNFVDGSEDGRDSYLQGFLGQFEVDFMQVDGESSQWEPRNNVVMNNEKLTLQDLVNNDLSKVKPAYKNGDRINLAPLTVAPGAEVEKGLPVDPADTDEVFIQITFKDDDTRVAGPNSEFVQNKFMNDSAKFYFNLEATQWDGVHVDTPNGNGEVNNGVQGSADGSNMPSPITKSKDNGNGDEVVDN